MRYAALGLIVVMSSGCDFIGGGDTVIRGENNVVMEDASRELVARELAQFESVPQVSDADLQQLYAVIRRQALEGNLDATLVMLRLASIQRQPAEDAEDH